MREEKIAGWAHSNRVIRKTLKSHHMAEVCSDYRRAFCMKKRICRDYCSWEGERTPRRRFKRCHPVEIVVRHLEVGEK